MIPTINTDRLILRAPVADDLDALIALWADPAVYRYIPGKRASRGETWHKLMAMLGHWQLMGYGYWIIEERKTHAFVGEAGFGNFKREIDPPLEGTLEAGWVLSPTFHGQGFGTEVVRAMLDWAAENFPETPITCLMSPDNAASFALAKKCGFMERCRTTYKDEPSLVMDWRG